MGATIAAKALVILALLGAGATGIYAVANKGFGSGKQTEKINETTAPAEAKPATDTAGASASASAGAAPGSTSTDGQQPQTPEGKQDGTPASGAPAASGTSSQNAGNDVAGGTGGTGGGNSVS